MPPTIPANKKTGATSGFISDDAFDGIMLRLLAPLARFCLAKGLTFAAAEELLKRAFVQEAMALQPGMTSHGAVSRISTTTGVSRREVTRLTRYESPERSAKPPLANQVFARWTADPALRDASGAPCALKRQGPAPSFEALAQSITRDVHPRTLLDELIRLGLACYDGDSDHVTLERSEFVPTGDKGQMLDFLADNVGDHFAAAVANVVKDDRRHIEQAVFADELSAESVEALRPLVVSQWQSLRDALVPALRAHIEADARAGRPQNQRVRIGLYTYNEATPNSVPSATENATITSRKNYRRVHK